MQAKRSTYRQIHEHRWFTRAICSKVDGVGGDDLVALVHEPEISDKRTVDLLAVVDDGRSLPDILSLSASLIRLVKGFPFSLAIARACLL